METIYVAKYALTSGIKEIQAEVRHSSFADSKEYAREPGGYNVLLSEVKHSDPLMKPKRKLKR